MSNFGNLTACFNPRSREGSDKGTPETVRASVSFNPRSREGSDQIRRRQQGGSTWFQSTLP